LRSIEVGFAAIDGRADQVHGFLPVHGGAIHKMMLKQG